MFDSLRPHTVHGILLARILEWVALPFSREFSQPRDWTWVSHIAGGFFASWATREAQRVQGDQDEVAEWSGGWSANPLCSAWVGSNPILLHLRLPRPAFSLGSPSGGSGFQWGKQTNKQKKNLSCQCRRWGFHQEDPQEEGMATHCSILAPLIAQLVMNLPAMQETSVRFLAQ